MAELQRPDQGAGGWNLSLLEQLMTRKCKWKVLCFKRGFRVSCKPMWRLTKHEEFRMRILLCN